MGRYDHDGRTDLRRAAAKRRADAWALVRAGSEHTRAATYLGGYAIECKLKAIAMEAFDCWTLRQLAARWQVPEQDVYSHGLEALIEQLPLRDNFHRSEAWPFFARHVNQWRASWRYDPRNPPVESAQTFLGAVDRVYKWLEANQC
jgi:hypothetical protein